MRSIRSVLEREARFAADAAHELRTPIAACRVMAQLALRSNDIDKCHHLINDVLYGLDRSAHIIDQLKILNSLRPETVMNDCVDVHMHDLVKGLIKEIRMLSDLPTAEIVNDIPLDVVIHANEGCMQILMRNLIDNAIRYSKDEIHVTVSSHRVGDQTLISVMDRGPGIPVESYSRVFDRFYREQGSGQSGSGLGLSIVSLICSLHGAQISLQPGEGGKGLKVSMGFTTSRNVGAQHAAPRYSVV